MTENDKKEKIIRAAYKILADQGYDKASTKEIAKEAGVAQGLINYYFPSKDKLFIEVFKHDLCQYCDRMAELFTDIEPPKEISFEFIQGLFQQLKQQALDYPEHYKIRYELFALGLRNENVQQELAANIREGREQIQQIIEKITGLPPHLTTSLAALLISAIDGFGLQVMADPSFDQDSAYDMLSHLLLAWFQSSNK